jgi:hypothetical protein
MVSGGTGLPVPPFALVEAGAAVVVDCSDESRGLVDGTCAEYSPRLPENIRC